MKYDPTAGGGTGDRNGDGKLDYRDGIVAMEDSTSFDVTSATWKATVNTMLTGAALLHGELGAAFTPFSLDWTAYRNWNLMKDFRAQAVEGGEYDFLKYVLTKGTGTEKDFWYTTEQLLGDSYGVVRNVMFNYDRNETGGTGADYLYGGAGQDQLHGGAGDDTIRSGWSGDRLYGDAGADKLYGERGDDILAGGAGADILDGGLGADTADYSGDAAAGGTGKITVTLDQSGNGTGVDGWGNTDQLVSIENGILTKYDDTLRGGFTVGAVHMFDGGEGIDTANLTSLADFREQTSAKTVTAWDGESGGRLVLKNFETFFTDSRFTLLPDTLKAYGPGGRVNARGEFLDYSGSKTGGYLDAGSLKEFTLTEA